jgi:hypothetical protein
MVDTFIPGKVTSENGVALRFMPHVVSEFTAKLGEFCLSKIFLKNIAASLVSVHTRKRIPYVIGSLLGPVSGLIWNELGGL